MNFKPPRKDYLQTSAEVLQALFENGKSPLSGPFVRWKIWRQWPELVGPSISAVSEPVAFRDGVLTVWVKNAAWMQQLVFAREQMKNTLNDKLGQGLIRSVHLTMDRKGVPSDSEEKKSLEKSVQGLIKK